MNIEPFKNDIGASVDCDLRTIKIDEITKKEKIISFENLLKLAMDYLDKDNSNIVR